MYERQLAIERIGAARMAIDAVDPDIMLIGRCEHFRVPAMSMGECVERAAAYATAGADCIFVPMVTDAAVLTELVAAVAPKSVSVLLPSLDVDPWTFAALGVRRCSTGGLLAAAAWSAFDVAAGGLFRKAAPRS